MNLTPGEKSLEESLLSRFERDKAKSKPISFYNWTPELEQVWRFCRFLQCEFLQTELEVPRAVAAVLADDPDLLEQYQAINAFYSRLTNPLICLPVDALIGTDEALAELAERYGARHGSVAILPPSTSREVELFERLFGTYFPPGVNLMVTLIDRIRSGEMELQPADNDGWYQYQVYALETMLLPTRGQEEQKLLLTASYKKRLIEAFKALVTKRRETHARQLGDYAYAEPLAAGEVRPRLRVEPCATYYLRTARAYAFLKNFLLAAVGPERLANLHGLKEDGYREPNLAEELEAVRQRFYGLYFISCEDLGMRPQFFADEPVQQHAARAAALAWLENFPDDPDLACDTRVAETIGHDTMRGKTRLWATLGVRLTHLEASYARPPKVRPKEKGGPWQDVESYQLGDSHYVIPVDEFAEFELAGSSALTRDELRTACDRYRTKEAILHAISQ